jgi:TonB-dependent SusC/RagA subfamily outer membrane receptor
MKNVLLNACSLACIKSVQTFRVLVMTAVCLSVFVQVNAQSAGSGGQIAVRGKVTDSKGVTLPAVAVQLKGTNIGTNTDAQGAYSINAPSNGTLVFTVLGYNTQEVAVDGKTTIDVALVEGQQALDEVVVTAFGVTKEKRALGYSVTEVRGDEFTQARSTNVAQSLTGKIAGVDATQFNNGPGGSSRVIIRGNTSLTGNQLPLYVVNGMAIDNRNAGPSTSSSGLNVDRGDGISSINPDDIESISVLKGGAAAALYGSQAANGVILITTKSGKAQKGIGVEINSNATFGTPNDFPLYQYEYGQGNDGVKPTTKATALSSGRLAFGAKMDGSMVMQFDGVARPYSPFYVKDNIKNFYRISSNIVNTVAFN